MAAYLDFGQQLEFKLRLGSKPLIWNRGTFSWLLKELNATYSIHVVHSPPRNKKTCDPGFQTPNCAWTLFFLNTLYGRQLESKSFPPWVYLSKSSFALTLIGLYIVALIHNLGSVLKLPRKQRKFERKKKVSQKV